jgi:hypothetical protein
MMVIGKTVDLDSLLSLRDREPRGADGIDDLRRRRVNLPLPERRPGFGPDDAVGLEILQDLKLEHRSLGLGAEMGIDAQLCAWP